MIQTLSILYDIVPDEISSLLSEFSQKGVSLLLIVLSTKDTKPSSFTNYLMKLVLQNRVHYMSLISTLWSSKQNFMIELIESLYNSAPQLLGRCFDIIDDLNILTEFLGNSSQKKIASVFSVFAFLRLGVDFTQHFTILYENLKDEALKNFYDIINEPKKFGIFQKLTISREIEGKKEPGSVASIFFFLLLIMFMQIYLKKGKKFINQFFLDLEVKII